MEILTPLFARYLGAFGGMATIIVAGACLAMLISEYRAARWRSEKRVHFADICTTVGVAGVALAACLTAFVWSF